MKDLFNAQPEPGGTRAKSIWEPGLPNQCGARRKAQEGGVAVAARSYNTPDSSADNIGFRVVRRGAAD
jgi:hypothetical protein